MSIVRRSSRARKTDEEEDYHLHVKPSTKYLDPCIYPRTGRRGAPQVFPRKLYQMMNESADDVITWTPNGTSFIILDMDTFSEEVLLNYFRHQKYSSFQRQLNLYGFHKISKGPETGAYAHDCFIRGKPELLIDVRRLPQRLAASVAKLKANSSRGSNKIIVRPSAVKPLPEPQSTLSRMTSCLKSTNNHRGSHENSDESEGYSESDYEGPENSPRLIHNSSIDSEADSEDGLSSELEGFVSFFNENEAIPQIEDIASDGIVKVQPLPKECYVPSSSIVTLSESVNQMALAKLSPRIAFAKHTTVHLAENARPWSVKISKSPSPDSPSSLQWMIPVLGRGGSSVQKTTEHDDVKLSTFLETEIESLEKEQPFSDSNRSKSFSIDTAILQEFATPPVFMSRLSSDDWNMTEPPQLTNSQLTTMFSLARKESIEGTPQPIQMERR